MFEVGALDCDDLHCRPMVRDSIVSGHKPLADRDASTDFTEDGGQENYASGSFSIYSFIAVCPIIWYSGF